MPTTELRTKEQLFAEMSRLVNTSNFNLAARDQFDRVKFLFDIATSSDAGEPTYDRFFHQQRTDPGAIVELRRQRDEATRRDPAVMQFFSSSKHDREPVVSDYGSKLTKESLRVNGRALGNIVSCGPTADLTLRCQAMRADSALRFFSGAKSSAR